MLNIATAAAHEPAFTRKGEGDIIELHDGRLLLAYMAFSGDASDLAPTQIAVLESDDGGATWTGNRVITATADGDLNVYSPNLIRGRDGGILLLFMRQHSAMPPAITLYVWKSVDEGATFTQLTEFAVGRDYSLCNAVVKRLACGRLLLPTSPVAQLGDDPYRHISCGAVLYSDDDGCSWTEAANRVYLPMRGVMEPHVEETRDGRVLMVVRSQLGSLFVAESADHGDSWSKPQTTGLRTPESCPELSRIPETGDLLMIWNDSPYDPAFASHYGKRSPLTAAVSRDEGRSWQQRRNIESDPLRAFSNPGCRWTRAGAALINYWTCVYLPDWCMQDIIDLRVARIDWRWFYEA